MGRLQPDEFNDDFLNTYIWTPALNNATFTETGGVLEFDIPGPSGGSAQIESIPVNIWSNFDLYMKVNLTPTESNQTVGIGYSLNEDWGGSNPPWAAFYFEWSNYHGQGWQYDIGVDYGDDSSYVDTYVTLGTDNPGPVWMRVKGLVGQRIRYFYAFSEPLTDDDWTEFIYPSFDDPPPTDWFLEAENCEFYIWAWANANGTPTEGDIEHVRLWPHQLVFDEFNDVQIGSQWLNKDAGGAVTSESENQLKMVQDTGQQALQRQANITLESQDVWCRMEMPPVLYADGNASNQMWFEDDTDYDGMGGAALYATTVKGVFTLDWWLDTDAYGENYYDTLEIYQNYVYFRLKLDWADPDMTVRYFYSLTEPNLDSDWIELNGFTITTEWKPTGFMSLYLAANPDNSNISREYFITYFRKWWIRGAEAALAPSLDQYQRLQGYPKVTHPLVYNRNTGQFEVMHQSKPAAPLPIVEGSDVLAYDASGNLSTVTRTINAIVYRKTLTYTAGDLTYVSNWVEQ